MFPWDNFDEATAPMAEYDRVKEQQLQWFLGPPSPLYPSEPDPVPSPPKKAASAPPRKVKRMSKVTKKKILESHLAQRENLPAKEQWAFLSWKDPKKKKKKPFRGFEK